MHPDEPHVGFAALGLVVFDEAHSFGVRQRGALDEGVRGCSPAATAEYERLRGTELVGLRVELTHGQLPSSAKAAAMEAFAGGAADVLLATGVVEGGHRRAQRLGDDHRGRRAF